MPLDINKEADKIEHMAKERIDTPDKDAGAITKSLLNEWGSLNKNERDLVAGVLHDKYYSCNSSGPIPYLERDQDGHICGIQFQANMFDFKSGPSGIDLRAVTAANGKESILLKTNPDQPYDGVREEAEKFEKMAEEKLHTPIEKSGAINKEMCTDFLHLSQEARNLLAKELTEDCNGTVGKPTVSEVDGRDGNCIGLGFQRSMFDSKPGPQYFKVGGSDQGGNYFALTMTKQDSKTGIVCDFKMADSPSTINDINNVLKFDHIPSK